jgi:cyclophilin family peptidyl-prolyl cis-trans isomerase
MKTDRHCRKTVLLTLVAAALAATLVACGGGGGDSGTPAPTVSAFATSTPRYSDPMLVTLVGTNLDGALTLTSAGCKNFARSTTAPNVSTATVAYYTCTVSGAGSQAITVTGGGQLAATVPFTVPKPQVTMLISNGSGVAGSLVITLEPGLTPITVDNFLAYVKSGFYNGTAIHRNGRTQSGGNFVLQGGGYDAPISSGSLFPAHKATNPPIALEAGLSNLHYTIAMARTSVPNSADSEFFFNTTDNVFLDTSGGGYAAFGRVTTNTSLVDAMAAAPCSASDINFGSGSPDCVPVPNLVVQSAQQSR